MMCVTVKEDVDPGVGAHQEKSGVGASFYSNQAKIT